MAPDVSVIIPVWNGAAYVGEAIRSALAQQDVSVEVIVVDDASTDDSASIAEAIGDPRLRVVRHGENAGPGAARNSGFREATGRWLAVLDADDTMQPDRLRHLVDLGEKDAVQIVADNLMLVPAGRPMFKPDDFPRTGYFNLEHLVRSERLFTRRWTFGYLKPLFSRKLVQSRGLTYQTDIRIGEDFIFLADCLATSAHMRLDPTPRYNYLVREGSTSSRTERSHIERMLRAQSDFEARHQLQPEWRQALAERRAGLEAADAYLAMVDHVKARRFGAALSIAAANPRGALLFRLPVAVRLQRLLAPFGGR